MPTYAVQCSVCFCELENSGRAPHNCSFKAGAYVIGMTVQHMRSYSASPVGSVPSSLQN